MNTPTSGVTTTGKPPTEAQEDLLSTLLNQFCGVADAQLLLNTAYRATQPTLRAVQARGWVVIRPPAGRNERMQAHYTMGDVQITAEGLAALCRWSRYAVIVHQRSMVEAAELKAHARRDWLAEMATRPYRLNEISVQLVDAAALARAMFDADADLIAGRQLPEHDYRVQVSAWIEDPDHPGDPKFGRKTTATTAAGQRCSADELIAGVNARYRNADKEDGS